MKNVTMILNIGTNELKSINAREEEALSPLNFKVNPEFRRRLKIYCAENGMTMVEFMVRTLNQEMRG